MHEAEKEPKSLQRRRDGGVRVEEDLIDQLFNSSEKRLARTLLLLARYGEAEQAGPGRAEDLAGNAGGDGRHDARSSEFLSEQSLLSVVLHD
jgi:hypothetical protein